jgi:hypothetical protein
VGPDSVRTTMSAQTGAGPEHSPFESCVSDGKNGLAPALDVGPSLGLVGGARTSRRGRGESVAPGSRCSVIWPRVTGDDGSSGSLCWAGGDRGPDAPDVGERAQPKPDREGADERRRPIESDQASTDRLGQPNVTHPDPCQSPKVGTISATVPGARAAPMTGPIASTSWNRRFSPHRPRSHPAPRP